MKTSAESTPTLSLAPSLNGGPLRPSEQVAVPQEIPTGLECSEQTVTVLVAILHALFRNTLSSDVMALSLMTAEDTAIKRGVPEAEFRRIASQVHREWLAERNKNPLVSMF